MKSLKKLIGIVSTMSESKTKEQTDAIHAGSVKIKLEVQKEPILGSAERTLTWK